MQLLLVALDWAMGESPAEVEVLDDEEHHRFLVRHDGAVGLLAYRVSGARLILVHAEVEPAIQGRGIAGRLMVAAVARASRTGETVAPWCPYARHWLESHPDEASTISVDWARPGAERAERTEP